VLTRCGIVSFYGEFCGCKNFMSATIGGMRNIDIDTVTWCKFLCWKYRCIAREPKGYKHLWTWEVGTVLHRYLSVEERGMQTTLIFTCLYFLDWFFLYVQHLIFFGSSIGQLLVYYQKIEVPRFPGARKPNYRKLCSTIFFIDLAFYL
jgi:hypothetical protein